MNVMQSLATKTMNIVAAFLLLPIPLFAGQAFAQGTWQFEATPYLFASAMKGDVKAGSLPKTAVDLSFSDILEQLDFGFMGTLEARRDRWMLFADAMYMNVSGSATASGVAPGGAAASVGADATVKQTMLAGALGYRVVEGPTAVDLLGGARYNRTDAEADIAGSLFGVSGSVNRGGDKSWWDPYVGVRLLHTVTDRWTIVGYADIGGFGVGSDSTWQALIGANFMVSKTVSAKFGYRILKVDYNNGGFIYDMKNDGLVIGVGIRF